MKKLFLQLLGAGLRQERDGMVFVDVAFFHGIDINVFCWIYDSPTKIFHNTLIEYRVAKESLTLRWHGQTV